MNNIPIISIIVTIYNLELYINDTFNSVINQTYQDWECIIIDDGSTDGSENICIEWIKKDERFKYFKKENGGTASARNEGLRLSRGKYIQFLDGDDIIDCQKLEIQLNQIGCSDVSFCEYDVFNEDMTIKYSSPLPTFLDISCIKRDIILHWESKISIPIHCIIFEKKLSVENQIYFSENFYNREDWIFWVKIFYNARDITHCNNKLVIYRNRPNSKVKSNLKIRRNEFLKAALFIASYFKKINKKKFYGYAIKKFWLIKKNIYLNYYYRARYLVKTKIISALTPEKKQK